jgi:hypothetical protein
MLVAGEAGPPRARVAAAICGIVAAIATTIVTFGGAIIAMIAIAIAFAVARRKGQPLTRGISWLVGVGSVGVVALIAVAVLTTQMPKGTFAAARKSMDSLSTAPQPPPPEWLRRITPPTSTQPPAFQQRLMRSGAFTAWVGVMMVVFLTSIVAAYAGTLGWLATLLMLFAATGRWLPRATRASP